MYVSEKWSDQHSFQINSSTTCQGHCMDEMCLTARKLLMTKIRTWWNSEGRNNVAPWIQSSSKEMDQIFSCSSSVCFVFSFYPLRTSHYLSFPRLSFRKDSTHTSWYTWEQSCCGQWKAPHHCGTSQDSGMGCTCVYLSGCSAHPLAPLSNTARQLEGVVHISRASKRKPVVLLICVLFWVLLWLEILKEKKKVKTEATWSLRWP